MIFFVFCFYAKSTNNASGNLQLKGVKILCVCLFVQIHFLFNFFLLLNKLCVTNFTVYSALENMCEYFKEKTIYSQDQ